MVGSVDQAASPAPASPLSQQAYETLRDRLILLDIAPGEPIQEARLIEDLGVGRTPIREALKRLEQDHLVVTYPRRGTFASAVDITQLAQISEVRRVLEPFAARRAAELGGGPVRAELEETLRAMGGENLGTDGTSRDLIGLDLRIHRLLYRATANPYLAETLVRYENLAVRIWSVALDRIASMTEHIDEHRGLLRAVLDRDAATAEQMSREHVEHFEQALRAAL